MPSDTNRMPRPSPLPERDESLYGGAGRAGVHQGVFILVGLFALSFHVLITPTIAGAIVRVGFSDALAVVVSIVLALTWARAPPSGAALPSKTVWIWLAGLTAWMVVSLLNARYADGEWSRWALVNKGLGWIVLMAYFALGCATAYVLGSRIRGWFVLALAVSGAAICIFSMAASAMDWNYIQDLGIERSPIVRLEGLAANPNAFSITILATFVLCVPHIGRYRLIPEWPGAVLLGILVAAGILSFSRSALLGFAAASLLLLLMRRLSFGLVLRTALVAAACIGATVVLSEFTGFPEEKVTGMDLESHRATMRQPGAYPIRQSEQILDLRTVSYDHRIQQAKSAFKMWRESPVIGIGLGSYLQRQKGEGLPERTIHSTGLWLLTETGIVGLVLFGAFFIYVFRMNYRRAKNEDDPFAVAMMAVLLMYAGASIGTEILYQRLPWFLLGLAVVQQVGQRAKAENPVSPTRPE